VAVVLFSVVQHFELVRHGYLIEELQQQRLKEEEMNRHLRLQIESLRAPGRIEEIARTKLNMEEPSREQAIVIERVVPSQPPSKAVVAAR
jgi:cell division protein FtsL